MLVDPLVSDVVSKLHDAVRKRAADLERDPTWGPVATPQVRLEFTRFLYGAGGLGDHELRWSPSVIHRWSGDALRAAVAGVQPDVEEAVSALSGMSTKAQRIGTAVSSLCDSLMLDELEGTPPSEEEVARRAELLFRSLRGLPVPAWTEADVVGVAVLSPPITFQAADGTRVSLRAIEEADLAGATYPEWAEAALQRVRAHPSAVLRVEYEAVDKTGWQPPLEKALAILRLFGVGGVEWTRAVAGTESLLEPYGAIVLRGGGDARTYCIREAEAARLARFWDRIGSVMPPRFYWEQPEVPLGLDAAWFNYETVTDGAGYVNRQVAEVIRSLESLLLSTRDRPLKRTLADRTARLLGACGFDAGVVRETMVRAYEVRSHHVHAEELTGTLLRNVEQAGGVVALLHRCMEYNRAALVSTLLAGVDKPGLLRLLEDAEALRSCGDAYRELYGLAPGS